MERKRELYEAVSQLPGMGQGWVEDGQGSAPGLASIHCSFFFVSDAKSSSCVCKGPTAVQDGVRQSEKREGERREELAQRVCVCVCVCACVRVRKVHFEGCPLPLHASSATYSMPLCRYRTTASTVHDKPRPTIYLLARGLPTLR